MNDHLTIKTFDAGTVARTIRDDLTSHPVGEATWQGMLNTLATESDRYRDLGMVDTADSLAYARETITESMPKNGHRLLRNPRKNCSNASRLFLRAFYWHGGRSGGSLWGPMGDRLYGEAYHVADSLAVAFRVATGLRMDAVDRWSRALGLEKLNTNEGN